MPAFQVSLNGKKVATAGVGGHGVLSANVTWVRRKGEQTRAKKPGGVEEELFLHLGGLITPKQEHVSWADCRLKVGDEVNVKIVESSIIDRLRVRRRSDPARDLREQSKHVRMMAKKFGWKISAKG